MMYVYGYAAQGEKGTILASALLYNKIILQCSTDYHERYT